MEDSAGDELSDTAAFLASILTPSDPENMKLAFSQMIDGIVLRGADVIIDWGTATFDSTRMVSDITGQELHRFRLLVHGINTGGDEDDRND